MFWLSCLAEVILFLESGHTERQREREIGGGGGGGGGSEIEQNLPLAWTSLSVACPTVNDMHAEERLARETRTWVEVHVTSEESVKAYRSVPTSCLDPLESKLGFSHLSIFSQSAELAARAAPNGVKKGATFLLLFRSLNHTDSSRKPFNGVQKGQVHSKKHKPSKKIFCGRSTQGSPPAGLNPKDYRIPMETGVSRKIIFRVWASGTTA